MQDRGHETAAAAWDRLESGHASVMLTASTNAHCAAWRCAEMSLIRPYSRKTGVKMRVDPMDATLGAYVHDVNLAELTEAEWAPIHSAFLEHAVLVFPGQGLTREEQVAFGLRFGDLESRSSTPYAYVEKTVERAGRPRVVDGVVELSNVDRTGHVITDERDPQVEFIAGNDQWHTDSSFRRVSARASILSCVEGPSAGGETAFADMRAALESLSPSERSRLSGLRAWHSLEWSQAVRGVGGTAPAADPTTMEGAYHDIIRRHPETGRESLFIGRHTCAIEGMDLDAAAPILSGLVDEACQPPRLISHHWTPGDVVVWDNRCVLHRVEAWDLHERRIMWHVRIGGAESEAA
jgi:alpha-ketoglutarate-dependent taurine dioxygenase